MSIAYTYLAATILICYCSCINAKNVKKLSLEEYCTDYVSGDMWYDVNPGLQKYFQQCRNWSAYTDCIFQKRYTVTDKSSYYVQPYEKYFPEKAPFRQIGFFFCYDNLQTVKYSFEKDEDMAKCKPDPDCRKKLVKGNIIVPLKKAVMEQDHKTAAKLSCDLLAPYIDCLRTSYVKCDKRYLEILNFELAKLGGDCLNRHLIHAPPANYLDCSNILLQSVSATPTIHLSHTAFTIGLGVFIICIM